VGALFCGLASLEKRVLPFFFPNWLRGCHGAAAPEQRGAAPGLVVWRNIGKKIKPAMETSQ
jgi:hypothetical protein